MGALKVELSDKYDNVIYFHTSSDIVYFNKRRAIGIDALNVQDAIVQLNDRVNEMIVLNEDMYNTVEMMKNTVIGVDNSLGQKVTMFTEVSYIGKDKFSATNNKPPYTQKLIVTGIRDTDEVFVSIIQSAEYETAKKQLSAYNCISRVVVNNGSVSFICYEDKPTINIPVKLLIIRKG